jgi:hypothetical protein
VRIELIVPDQAPAGQDFVMRALLVNDSYEPVEIWRNAFVGPTAEPGTGAPVAPSVEPTFGQPEQPLLLQPFTFYGRDRQSGPMEPGVVVVAARYQPEGAEGLSASRAVRIE